MFFVHLHFFSVRFKKKKTYLKIPLKNVLHLYSEDISTSDIIHIYEKMKILYIWITFYECEILCQNNILNKDV